MAKNEFLPFGTAEGANVLAAPEYENLAARHNGFTSGVAKSKELNKVWRQASLIASAVAQFIVDTDQKDLLDTGDVANIKNRLVSALNLIISNGDYVTNPYLKLELLKKIDKADISQQLGNDTGKVPSLSLLVNELGKKAGVADVNGKLAKDQNGADIPNKPKFIENLGLPEKSANGKNFITDGGHRRILAGDGIHQAVLSDTGYFGVKNDKGSVWEFNPLGVMVAGSVPIARLTGTDDITVPVGTVITVAHNKQVAGRFLKTNGTAVSRTAYADLFSAIGTTYGAGDGGTTFNLPDTRDEFPRFAGDSRAVGSKQGDAMRNIVGSYATAKSDTSTIISHTAGAFKLIEDSSQWYSIKTAPSVGGNFVMQFNLENTSLPLASENRSRNIAFAGWIKY